MLADTSRLKILLALGRNGPMNVTALRRVLAETHPNVSQPAVSHHLALMRACHLVRCDRKGKQCFYELDSAEVSTLLERLFSELGNGSRNIHLDELALSFKRR
jgi:ArsR family transcriptional regulator